MPDINSILQFFRDNPGAAAILVFVLGAIGVAIRYAFLGIREYRREMRARSMRGNTFPFDVIKPNQSAVSALMDGGRGSDPLPPSRIPYQTRTSGRDTQAELDKLLEEKHWVLILGRTGLGKTREAAELAQRLNQHGWTILNLTRTELVMEPATFPHAEIGTDRKLLFILDDLNTKAARGKTEGITPPSKPQDQVQVPLQLRLQRTLEAYKNFCGEQEIRVIATARNEPVPESAGEPSELEKLELEHFTSFWGRFARYELPAPDVDAQASTLGQTAQIANIPTELTHQDLQMLARTNDGTFRNLAQNLRNAKLEERPLTPDNFVPTLQGTWQDQYRRTVARYKGARFIYDAVELLQKARIDLYPFTIEPTARLIANGNLIEQTVHWFEIRRALPFMIHSQRILTPADGQISAKPIQIDLDNYLEPTSPLSPLARLILQVSDRHPNEMLDSLVGFGITLYEARQWEQAVTVWKKGTVLAPKASSLWSNVGAALAELNRPADAEAAYRQAIELNPQYAAAYNNLGNLLADTNRPADAEAAYRQAIELNPQYAAAYYNLGLLLHEKLNRPADAEAAYRQAIELNPQDTKAYVNLGVLLQSMNRPADAEAAYRTAIELDPQLAEAHGNLAYLLRTTNRPTEAEPLYRRALELDPENPNRYFGLIILLRQANRLSEALPLAEKYHSLASDDADAVMVLAGVLKELGRDEEARTHADKARSLLKEDRWYDRACVESIAGNADAALNALEHAAQQEDFDSAWAKEDPDLAWIRADPRFAAIVK